MAVAFGAGAGTVLAIAGATVLLLRATGKAG
jgi:hypothetical protein